MQTADYVVRTLLKQLLFTLDLIPRELEDVYDDCCFHKQKAPDRTFFTRHLLSATGKFSSVYIMLDALDECTSGTLDNTINIIRQLKDSWIKVFCTFRPILINIGDRLDISTIYSIGAHEEDIRNYLSIRLNKEWRHDKCFLERIINQLAECAEGK